MTFAERKTLRLNLLKELYDYHFANNGNMFGLKSLKEEVALAYKYLECKGFIAYSDYFQHGSIAITPAGIDYIEESHTN